jgi:hypothetical protein
MVMAKHSPSKQNRAVVDAVKSKAVVLYTSRGRLPMPLADPEAVRRLPVLEAAQLVGYVEDLVAEMFEAFPLSWRADADVEADPAELDPGLARSMELVEAGMAARHPEEDAEAAGALAWMWGYSAWK